MLLAIVRQFSALNLERECRTRGVQGTKGLLTNVLFLEGYKNMEKILLVTVCLLGYSAVSACGTNLALGKTATASSVQQSGNEASKAVDGDTTTRWSSAFNDSQWINVDLGSSCYVDTVKLRWENACATEYYMRVSSDGSTWTNAAHITNGVQEYRSIPLGHVSARYVQMHGIHRTTPYGYSIYEFEVYGSVVPPNHPPTNISLSNTNVNEGLPSGTIVGTFSSTDPDSGNTFTYSFDTGSGSTDNASFAINGSSLNSASIFNDSAQSSYSIRIRTTDQGGLFFDNQFTISITKPNYASPATYPNATGALNNMKVDGYTTIAGSLGVGTTTVPSSALEVNGEIKCQSIVIKDWRLREATAPADYVFDSNYKLPALQDVEKFVSKNSHLPGMPNASSMRNNGVDVIEMNMALLKKVEELTLYAIKQQKTIDLLVRENEKQQAQIEEIDRKVTK